MANASIALPQIDLRQAILDIAGPGEPGEYVKTMLARAAKHAGIHFRVAGALYHREIIAPGPRLAARIADAQERLSKQRIQSASIITTGEDDANLRLQLEDVHKKLDTILAQLAAMAREE